MSTIDSRVVEMKFDNSQFQRGIQTSLSSLASLKNGLNLKGATQSLSELDAAGKRFSLAGMASGVEQISSKFSALGIMGVTALVNITNQAVNTGLAIVKSLTIAPIADGMNDYLAKLTSVQTIMNATGSSIETVSGYFGELDTYADKTIYNLTDMTGAFAKFTNAGVDMDKSVPAIKGIANMVALAGQDAGAASIAMYNLSQSIAGGFLTTTDYKSLNLANVATKEWKTQMIEGALAAGKLKEGTDGLYEIPGAKGAHTDAQLFNEQLAEGWATTEVLMDVLGKYGDTTTEIGAKAQAAAQDVKSYGMMMETLTAGVGTGWTDTFEIVIGNIEEAKALWTPLTNMLGGFMDSVSAARNDPLKEWKSLGGRTAGIEAIKNAFEGLMGIIRPIKEAFREIFPATTGAQLMAITTAIKNFSEGLKVSSETGDAIKRTFKGVFAVFDIALTIIGQVVGLLFRLIGGLSGTGGGLLKVTATFGDFLVAIRDALKSGEGLNNFFRILGNVIMVPIGLIRLLVDLIGNAFSSISDFVFPDLQMPDMAGGIPGLEKMNDAITHVRENLNPLEGLGQKISDIWSKLSVVFQKVWDYFSPVAEKLGDMFKELGVILVESLNDLNFDQVLKAINTGLFAGLVLMIKNFIGGGKKQLEDSGSMLDGIKDVLGGVTDTLGAMQSTLRAKTLILIALAIGILTVSLIGLATLDADELETSLIGLAGVFTQLMIAMAILGTMTKGAGFLKLPFIAASLILLSTAILILVFAVKQMSDLSWDEMLVGLAGVSGLLVALAISAKLMSGAHGPLLRTAATLILVSVALRMLVDVVRDLGGIDKVNLTKGLIAVAGLLVALALFSKIQSGNKSALIASVGFIILAEALTRIAEVVKTLGGIDKVNLIKGLAAVTGILAALAIFSRTMGNPISLVIAGAAMIIIGNALRTIATVVYMLGAIDKVNLIKGLAAITAILAAIMLFSRTVGNPIQLVIAGAAMLIIGNALQEISKAVLAMGSIDKVNLIKGLAAITVILAAIVGFSHTVGNPIKLVIAGAAMLIIGNALQEIAKAMWVVGQIDKVNVIKGLAAITVILAAIAGFSHTVGNPIKLVIAGAAMIIIGNALQEIAKAVYVMGSIDKVNLIKGLVAITAILAAIAAFNAVSGNPIKMAASAGALIILGIALDGLADAVGKMGNMSIETLAKGLIGMGAALLIIAGAMHLMPLTMLLSAAALVVVAGALKTLGEVMQDLGSMSWEEIGKGLVALAGGLIVIAGAMYLMSGGIAGAAAMLVMAAALRIFVPVLTTLGDMSWSQIGIGLVALAGAFLVLGIAGALLTPVIPTLLGLGISLSLLGVAAVLVGAGLLMASVGLTAIGVSGAVAIPILIELIKQIIMLIPFILEQLGLGIVRLAEVLAAAAGPLTEALTTLLLALLEAINVLAPKIVETAMNLIWLLINTLLNHLPQLIDAGFTLLIGLLDGIANNIGRVIDSAVNIIVNFINGIANNLPRIIQAGVDLIISLIQGISNAIPQLLQAGADLIIGFIESLATTIRNNQSRMDTAGRDLAWAIADGMTGGLASKAAELGQKAADMAKGALDAAKRVLGIESPSKEFFKVGEWSGEGMADGLVAMGSTVGKAGESMGDSALTSVKKSISQIASAVSNEMDVNPTIRPVLDLSAIKKDSSFINDMMGGANLKVDGISANAIAAEAGYLANQEALREQTVVAESEPRAVVYNQYNNSPKALTTIEIYRQTRNQLASAKG